MCAVVERCKWDLQVRGSIEDDALCVDHGSCKHGWFLSSCKHGWFVSSCSLIGEQCDVVGHKLPPGLLEPG